MRGPIAYYGGKAGLARRLVDLLPPHRVYMEPFFGGGAVLFAKRPGPFEIVNDLDGNVVTFFQVLRDRPDELEHVCRLTPYARDEFRAAELDEDLDDLERARRFWVRVNQSFAKSSGQQTGWSITTARSVSAPASTVSRLSRFHAVAARLSTVSIENCDAVDLIGRLATPDTCIYADPPYLAETRRGRDRQRPGDYLVDMGDEPNHRRLADALHGTDAAVVLSGYPSPLYDDLYGDWCRIEVPVNVHASNAVATGRGQRTEVIWSNRQLDEGRLFATGSAS